LPKVTPFASLAAQLGTTLGTVAGVAATYSRGDSSAPITATPGNALVDVSQGERVIQANAQDWIVTASELVLDDVVVEPRRGDRITVAGRGVFEVLDPPYRPMDGSAVLLRVYSKRTGVAS
jgi:hypothetical protein